jgi:hypothetical protein
LQLIFFRFATVTSLTYPIEQVDSGSSEEGLFGGNIVLQSQAGPPVVITWRGAGDGTSWSDPQNWAGQHVPGPTNNVFITNGLGSNVVISSAVSVQNNLCSKALTISNGSLTVTSGSSSLQGALTISIGGTLSAGGNGTALTSSSSIIADGANFAVSGGAVVTLPGLQSVNMGCAQWSVSGSNSALALPALTNLNCGGFECGPNIQAAAGGELAATNLAGIVLTSSFGGGGTVTADGITSLIDFIGLQNCSGNGPLTFQASNGGNEKHVGQQPARPNLDLRGKRFGRNQRGPRRYGRSVPGKNL